MNIAQRIMRIKQAQKAWLEQDESMIKHFTESELQEIILYAEIIMSNSQVLSNSHTDMKLLIKFLQRTIENRTSTTIEQPFVK